MLQKIDEITLRRLRVAERLQKMNPLNFDMSSACDCIAGQTLREFAPHKLHQSEWMEWSDISEAARVWLGLSLAEAKALFTPEDYSGRRYHAKDAARVVRYLAATGLVDWDVGGWRKKTTIESRAYYYMPNLSEDEDLLELA